MMELRGLRDLRGASSDSADARTKAFTAKNAEDAKTLVLETDHVFP
jgi:hypothetical protein